MCVIHSDYSYCVPVLCQVSLRSRSEVDQVNLEAEIALLSDSLSWLQHQLERCVRNDLQRTVLHFDDVAKVDDAVSSDEIKADFHREFLACRNSLVRWVEEFDDCQPSSSSLSCSDVSDEPLTHRRRLFVR